MAQELYIVRITLKDGHCAEMANRALLAVGYHPHSTKFCHMYNLEDSMVELKHNAQTSKHTLLICYRIFRIRIAQMFFYMICHYFFLLYVLRRTIP